MQNPATNKKIKDAFDNADTYISQMSKWDDKRLQKHLELFRLQAGMAYEQKNDESLELLQSYEEQVIRARLRKLK